MVVYTYNPENVKKNEFVVKRNIEFAKLLAELLQTQFLGEFKIESGKKLDTDDILFPFAPLNINEAEAIGIKKDIQIYGSIVDELLTTKSIFHPLLSDESPHPPSFPLLFQKELSKAKCVLPGFTVFDIKSLEQAFLDLNKKNFVVRVKDPTGSFGMNQYRVSDIVELNSLLKTIDKDVLSRFGMIVEANMVNGSPDNRPQTFSGGWINIAGSTYSYVGRQTTGDTVTPHTYLGTKLWMVKENLEVLRNNVDNTDFIKIIEILSVLQSAVKKIPDLICTRYNFDFLKGKYEYTDKTRSDEYVFGVVDQGFSVGGATGAELLAKKELDSNKNLNIVTASYKVNYGNVPHNIGKGCVPFFLGSDPKLGEIQVWGELS